MNFADELQRKVPAVVGLLGLLRRWALISLLAGAGFEARSQRLKII
jgi:hypothetical protein